MRAMGDGKLGNSLQYTAARDLAPFPCYLRRADKFAGVPRQNYNIHFGDKQHLEECSTFNFMDDRRFVDDRISKKQHRPCLLAGKLKWSTSNKFPRHQMKNFIRVTKIGPVPVSQECNKTRMNGFPIRLTAVSKVRKITAVKDNDPGPGPGSYDIPSFFGRKSCTYDPCTAQNDQKQNSLIRYLDSLVRKALRENLPGPGKYMIPKYPFDKKTVPLNRNIRPNVSINKLEQDSKKEPKRKQKTTVSIGPSTYNVQNDNISYKVDQWRKAVQRQMGNKRMFHKRWACEAVVDL